MHFPCSPSQIFPMAYFLSAHLALLWLFFFFPITLVKYISFLFYLCLAKSLTSELPFGVCVCVAIPQGKHFISDLLPLINYKIK